MVQLKEVNFYFVLCCSVGVILSCYALLVEIKKEANPEYHAYCDINEYISCTKAFSSSYGKGFGIFRVLFGEDSILNQPNGLCGIIFYLILAMLCGSGRKKVVKLQLILCLISNFISVYLAYILYFILEDFCIVCVGTYIVNAFNLILSISKWYAISNEKTLHSD